MPKNVVRPFRSVQVVSSLALEYQGLSTAVATWSRNLARNNHDVQVVATELPVGSSPVNVAPARPYLMNPSKLVSVWTGHSWGAARNIEQMIRDSDIVHVHGFWHHPGYTAAKLAIKLKKPLIFSAHGEILPPALSIHSARKSIYMRAIQRRLLSSAAGFHALTSQEETEFSKMFPDVRSVTIPNGLEPLEDQSGLSAEPAENYWPELSGQYVILYMGRLHLKKGVDLLLEALQKVIADHQNVKLVVAGSDFGEEAELRKLASQLGLDRHVLWAGYVDGSKKRALLQRSDVHVLPSRSDVIGLSTLEAMQAGIPVVITEECGADTVGESQAGIIVKAAPAQIAGALVQLIDNPGMAEKMGTQGIALIEREFSANTNSQHLNDYYESVIEDWNSEIRNFKSFRAHAEIPNAETQPLRVLHVASSLAPEFAGLSTAVANWVSNQAKIGCDTVVITVQKPSHKEQFSVAPALNLTHKSSMISRLWTSHSRTVGSDIEAVGKNADVIHIHGLWHYPHYLAARVAKKYNIPLVVSPHGEMSAEALTVHSGRKYAYRRLLQHRLFKAVTSFHAITNLEAAAIQNFVPGSSAKIIPNGLDRQNKPPAGNPDEFDAAFPEIKGKFVILYLARLHQIKGGDILINAFAELVENHPSIHLVMAGRDSGFESELRQLTMHHSLADRITFTGHVTGNAKASLLARANLYVLPSRSDTVGYATLEAMQAELPVVITDQCGAPDVALSGAGIEAEATVDSIRDALETMISNDELRLGMGKLGAMLVAKNYDAEKNSGRMIEFYKTLAAKSAVKLSVS